MGDVHLDTQTELAKAQLEHNRAFARGYAARAAAPPPGSVRPRVLVSGFGRFLEHATNATGLLLSRLVVDLDYPHTEPPPEGTIDLAGPQLAVGQGAVELEGVGGVEVCAVILPVFWDLAAYVLLREIEAFAPDVVVMNGVAGPRQKLWLELGAVNRAKDSPDASNLLRPSAATDPLIARAGDGDRARSHLASWEAIGSAARATLASRAAVSHEGEPLEAVMQGVAFAGFPRSTNTYLCNATSYVVGYALDHPGEPIAMLESDDGAIELTFSTSGDAISPSVPRWFMHWPSALDGPQLDAAADVLRSVIAAQLLALVEGPAPSRGDNALAEIPATP